MVSLVLIPLVLGLSYYGRVPFRLFILTVQLLAGHELLNLIQQKRIKTFPIASAIWLTACLTVSAVFPQIPLILLGLGWMLMLTILMVSRGETENSITTYSAGVGAMLYILLPGWFWYQLQSEFGFFFLMVVYAGTWVPDSGAYFVGSAFGRHKISPSISPKKSLEGLIGGAAITILIIYGLGTWGNQRLGLDFKPWMMVLYAILISIIGFYGDLFESMLKRDAAVKDSSHLIPGHGGVLDRLDSFYFNIIFSYYFFMWFL